MDENDAKNADGDARASPEEAGTDPETPSWSGGIPQEQANPPAAERPSWSGGTSQAQANPPGPDDESDEHDATIVAPDEPSVPPNPRNVRARRETATARGSITRRADTRSGEVIGGRYRIERQVARGGMGKVYLATQLKLERPVAIKVLNPEFQKTDPQFVRRFCLEAAISAKLSHPNVITIHDYGETDDGDLFMAMEYLDGRPLSRVIAKEAPFPPSRMLHVAIQICKGLREAHAKGVIHRDLKPGNVMLIKTDDDPDFVKVLDFGLVKIFQKEHTSDAFGELVEATEAGEPDLTRAGTLLGSPRYMSPEQIRGEDLDPRTDIYSFGVMLYQMAAGRAPFSGKTSIDVIYKHVNHEVPPLDSGADCPPIIQDIIFRCLAKDRGERFASMSELLTTLREAARLVLGSGGSTDSIRIAGVMAQQLLVSPQSQIAGDSSSNGSGASADDRALTPAAEEAAFRDDALQDEPTPSQSMVSAPRPRRSPKRMYALALTLAAVICVLLFQVVGTPPTPKSEVPAAAPDTPTTAPNIAEAPEVPTATVTPPTITFTSQPPGATVLMGTKGIGRTPFRRQFRPGPTRFTFVLSGHQQLTLERTIEDADQVVQATLEPITATPTPKQRRRRRKPDSRASERGPPPTAQKASPAKTTETKPPKADPDGDPETEDASKKRRSYYRDNPY